MVRPLLELNAGNHVDKSFGSTFVAIALFLSISALVALCAKHGRSRAPHKSDDAGRRSNTTSSTTTTTRSPLASPIRTIWRNSNKAIVHNDQAYNNNNGIDEEEEKENMEERCEGHEGEGGLWQKSIMMGDKCRPPEFSGVIYYDSNGNQLAEMPRSPRSSPLLNHSFSFPVLS